MRAWSIAAGVHMSAYVCVPIRVCIHGRAYRCVFMSVNVCVYVCVYLFARMRMRAHANITCLRACLLRAGLEPLHAAISVHRYVRRMYVRVFRHMYARACACLHVRIRA
jgi:hypothetical protein